MEVRNEKKYREVLPCGILTTPTGRKYWLLSPHPVVGDSWETDELYRFSVVPFDRISVSDRVNQYSYARHLITPAPEIEYIFGETPIRIRGLRESPIYEMYQKI